MSKSLNSSKEIENRLAISMKHFDDEEPSCVNNDQLNGLIEVERIRNIIVTNIHNQFMSD